MAQGFSIQSLNRAGDSALFPKATKFFNEKAKEIVIQNNKESIYDLLDDETGLPKGTEVDFRNAAIFEEMQAKIDPNYKPSIVTQAKDNDDYDYAYGNVGGNVLYKYDSNNDGKYDTFVSFENGKLASFGKKDETDNLGYMLVDYNRNAYLYDEPYSYDSVLHNYFSPIYEGEDGQGHFGTQVSYSEHNLSDTESVIGLWYDHYNVSYNEDGSVKDLSIPEDSHYNGI